MDELITMETIGTLLQPATWAAFVGALLGILLVITRRVTNGNLDLGTKRLVDKIAAVVGAAATGLITAPSDTFVDIMTPILVAMLVVGLSVGLYKEIGDRIFKRKSDE